MRRIVLKLDYIGSNYCGWQRQIGVDSVQSKVEQALLRLTGETITVTASGRTDAGVHALGQVVHFDTVSNIPVKNFVTGLNHFLPSDIRVLTAKKLSQKFHARFSAKEKTYCYVMYESEVDKSVYYNRAVRIKGKLDVKKMNDAGKAFLGEHDFTSYMSTGADTVGAVRTVKDLRVVRHGGFVKIYVTANGFLYNMVRLIAGTLVRAGKGELTASDVSALIDKKSKDAVREVMPACGLYLMQVKYK